ncbi:MAG: hypothetical protein NC299_11950 [Lachnospiraceae bacterium]|nr:hypothetical protein [Lachnospiraceae bacterium]
MRVKALCGVIYKGELYRADEEFEAERQPANTALVKANAPEPAPDETVKIPDLGLNPNEGKSKKRR